MNATAAEMTRLFSDMQRPLRFSEGTPNMEPRDPVRITELAPIIVPDLEGASLISRPWSSKGPNGAPVFNFRSEGRRFPTRTRCAIPTDGFYEFTTPDGPKAKRKDRWLFTMRGEPIFFIAGHMPAAAWTMLTVEPGPDVALLHNRQIVVMSPAEAVAWLDGAPEAEILRPSPACTLAVVPSPAAS